MRFIKKYTPLDSTLYYIGGAKSNTLRVESRLLSLYISHSLSLSSIDVAMMLNDKSVFNTATHSSLCT
jgi:hypothetical protein